MNFFSIINQAWQVYENLFSKDLLANSYKDSYDHIEAYYGTGNIFFGSQKGLFGEYVCNVNTRHKESPYFGRVLATDGNWRQDGPWKSLDNKWTYFKNKAFWAGGMEAGRTFVLLTKIEFYRNNNRKVNPDKGTVKELLWLMDNGYISSPSIDNPDNTIFIPAGNRNKPIFIKQYPMKAKKERTEAATRINDLIDSAIRNRNNKKKVLIKTNNNKRSRNEFANKTSYTNNQYNNRKNFINKNNKLKEGKTDVNYKNYQFELSARNLIWSNQNTVEEPEEFSKFREIKTSDNIISEPPLKKVRYNTMYPRSD